MAKKEDEYLSYGDALKKADQQQSTPRMERLRRLAADEKKTKKTQSFRIIAACLIVGGLAINYMVFSYNPDKARLEAERVVAEHEKAATLAMVPAVETKLDKIEKQFSGWDGSHRDLVRRTKRQMHDPSSFEHVKTKYVEKDGYLMVMMSYRGNNGFGAKILSSANAFYTIDGDYKGQLPE